MSKAGHVSARNQENPSRKPLLTLTDPHADAHPTPGDHAGDLERTAALVAHQAVPGLQAARGAAAPRAFALYGLVALWLGLLGVLQIFAPLLALAFTHDASHQASGTDGFNLPNTPKRSLLHEFKRDIKSRITAESTSTFDLHRKGQVLRLNVTFYPVCSRCVLQGRLWWFNLPTTPTKHTLAR